MPRPDEGLIHAWLDGELDAAEAARVEQLVETDAEWGAAAAEARGLIAASSRILGALDVVAGDVIPQGASAAPVRAGATKLEALDGAHHATPDTRRVRRAVPVWMRVAAGLVLVAGVAYLGNDRAASSVAMVQEAGPISEEVASAVANEVAPPLAPQAAPTAAPGVTSGVASGVAPSATRAVAPAASPTAASASAAGAGLAGNDRVAESPRAESELSRTAQVERRADVPTRAADVVSEPAAPPPARATEPSPVASALARARQLQSDSVRRARGFSDDLRLEQVVVTGAASAPTTQLADRGAAAPAAPPVITPQQPSAKTATTTAKAAPMSPGELMAGSGGRAPQPAPQAVADAGTSGPLPVIEGCFRVRTRAQIDTLLINPTILGTAGDSIRIAMNANQGYAWVRRGTGGSLTGRVWWQGSRTANLRADPIDCS